MSKNLIQGVKNYFANTHRFFNYGSSSVNVLSNLYNASPVEVLTLQNGNMGIGTNIPLSKLDVRGNIVCSNISVIGDFVTLNTITSNTEQMVIENAGTGPALKVTQTGNNSVAEFYDKESGVALFVGNGGNVGIGTNNPLSALHVNGNIYSGNIGFKLWQVITTLPSTANTTTNVNLPSGLLISNIIGMYGVTLQTPGGNTQKLVSGSSRDSNWYWDFWTQNNGSTQFTIWTGPSATTVLGATVSCIFITNN